MFATFIRRKPVDWNKVKSVLVKEDFVAVNEQRARHMELTRILATPIPKLDMSLYKEQLDNQTLVADIESTLKSFKPATADVEPVLKSLREQRLSAVEKAKETVDHVTKTVAGFKADLEAIKNIKHYSQLEVFTLFPP